MIEIEYWNRILNIEIEKRKFYQHKSPILIKKYRY